MAKESLTLKRESHAEEMVEEKDKEEEEVVLKEEGVTESLLQVELMLKF